MQPSLTESVRALEVCHGTQFAKQYEQIYIDGKKDYWKNLAIEIEHYCESHSIKHTNVSVKSSRDFCG